VPHEIRLLDNAPAMVDEGEEDLGRFRGQGYRRTMPPQHSLVTIEMKLSELVDDLVRRHVESLFFGRRDRNTPAPGRALRTI
jgi:hypothetical protein